MFSTNQGSREGSLRDLNETDFVKRRKHGRTEEEELQDEGPQAQDPLEGHEAGFFEVRIMW